VSKKSGVIPSANYINLVNSIFESSAKLEKHKLGWANSLHQLGNIIDRSNSEKIEKVDELCAKLNCDPFRVLIHIENDENTNVELRVNTLKELAQYLYPKKKSVEVSSYVSLEPSIQIVLPDNGTSNT
jgi:hypothetical protein